MCTRTLSTQPYWLLQSVIVHQSLILQSAKPSSRTWPLAEAYVISRERFVKIFRKNHRCDNHNPRIIWQISNLFTWKLLSRFKIILYTCSRTAVLIGPTNSRLESSSASSKEFEITMYLNSAKYKREICQAVNTEVFHSVNKDCLRNDFFQKIKLFELVHSW